MKLQKEPISFNFDYKKNFPIKPISKLSKYLDYLYYASLYAISGVIFIVVLLNTSFNEDPESFYYESQDIIELSSQVNKDIQKELNSIPLDKLAHSLYEDVAFKNIKEIASSLKKENKNIEFIIDKAHVEKIKQENKRDKQHMYNVTMPYKEKFIVGKKVVEIDKNLNYIIFQNYYGLIVEDIKISNPIVSNKGL